MPTLHLTFGPWREDLGFSLPILVLSYFVIVDFADPVHIRRCKIIAGEAEGKFLDAQDTGIN